jgi:hypothetical protein
MAGPSREKDPDPYGLVTSNKVKTGFVRGTTFGVKPVQYADVDGVAMFEGDIVLGTVAEMDALAKRVQGGQRPDPSVPFGIGITGENFRWPGGVVPYTIDPNLQNQARVTDAIAHWESNTRIRFIPRTDANAAQYPNYITFRPHATQCSSMVGMQGGQQFINLADGCPLGATIHEIAHAVGLWHEQSREDRDSFITINWANIKPGTEHNFNQHIADGDDIGAYDFDSIMHYGAHAFAVGSDPTIVTIGGQTIGQRNGLSAGDIAAVRALYPQLEVSRNWEAEVFRNSVPANEVRAWFGRGWPAYWNVVFRVIPLSPFQDGSPQLGLRVQAVRHAAPFIKYWFLVTNHSASEVQFVIKAEVLGWAN